MEMAVGGGASAANIRCQCFVQVHPNFSSIFDGRPDVHSVSGITEGLRKSNAAASPNGTQLFLVLIDIDTRLWTPRELSAAFRRALFYQRSGRESYRVDTYRFVRLPRLHGRASLTASWTSPHHRQHFHPHASSHILLEVNTAGQLDLTNKSSDYAFESQNHQSRDGGEAHSTIIHSFKFWRTMTDQCWQFASSRDTPKELPGDEPNDVLFSSKFGVRTIELNRPKKLNSLNGSMARKIVPRLQARFDEDTDQELGD